MNEREIGLEKDREIYKLTGFLLINKDKYKIINYLIYVDFQCICR